ncbi:helix-turn-helix domain-containing protein [Sulfitobacter sp. 1A13679]|uniref:helix-turn-helix domain-containing protein n=1 Tax=Sulfitobacter sp. 1A13679 TaxID=3368597 RepID=UPI003745CDD4
MTEQEAAKYLRLSTKTLQRRRRDGQIAFIRDGGIRYLRADLDTYLAARRTPAIKAPPPAPKPKYRARVTPDYDTLDLLFN